MAENTASQREETSKGGTLILELTTEGDESLPVFVSGNFNNWAVGEERYRLRKTGNGKYRLEFIQDVALPDVLEYKYNRGNWDSEELDEFGNAAANRIAERDVRLKEDYVPRWKRNGLAYKPEFLPQIQVISEQFEIPQLIKTRRIAALLPYNYSDSDHRYPVLYLQDGQNLFDDFAPFGNWAVDKKLALMSEKGLGDIIIISIDHAEDERIAEFTPSYHTRLGRGDGKKYVRFLADTLKPYIDKHFRTLPQREHTGIGGSSMGGLISIYAGMMYPEVYSKLMVFSPSLWVAPNIHFNTIDFEEDFSMKIYLYGGSGEGSNMVPNMKRFKGAIEKQGGGARIEFKVSIDPQGKHNEARWGEEFPKAAEWLFF